jgi:type IV pilus assembly protein PilX
MRHPQHPPRKTSSTGVSLLFALLSLVALTLAAVALVRSVDTGALVLGNLGLKQEATAVSDQASNRAIDWLNAHIDSLITDSATNGYYATSNEDLDVTGQQLVNDGTPRALVNWDMDGCAYAADIQHATCKLQPSDEFVLNGNKIRYVVLRLCDTPGDPTVAGNSCAQPLAAGPGKAATKGSVDYSRYKRFTDDTGGVYYRVVVRVVGARKTTSYIETIVHL